MALLGCASITSAFRAGRGPYRPLPLRAALRYVARRPAGLSPTSMGPPPRKCQPVLSSQVSARATDGPSRLSGGMNEAAPPPRRWRGSVDDRVISEQ
jgi:hypothetical protein